MIFALKEGLQCLNGITKTVLGFPGVSRSVLLAGLGLQFGSCLRLAQAAREMSPVVRVLQHPLNEFLGNSAYMMLSFRGGGSQARRALVPEERLTLPPKGTLTDGQSKGFDITGICLLWPSQSKKQRLKKNAIKKTWEQAS